MVRGRYSCKGCLPLKCRLFRASIERRRFLNPRGACCLLLPAPDTCPDHAPSEGSFSRHTRSRNSMKIFARFTHGVFTAFSDMPRLLYGLCFPYILRSLRNIPAGRMPLERTLGAGYQLGVTYVAPPDLELKSGPVILSPARLCSTPSNRCMPLPRGAV